MRIANEYLTLNYPQRIRSAGSLQYYLKTLLPLVIIMLLLLII